MLGAPLSLAVQFFAARALGPAGYGGYSFLNGFFTEVVNFLDAGTSAGFYAKLCARPSEYALVAFYWRFTGGLALALLGLVAFVQSIGIGGRVWPEQESLHVWLAALVALALWVAGTVGRVIDAYGRTVAGEKLRLLQRALLAVAVAGLFALGVLGLTEYFVVQLLASVVLVCFGKLVLRPAGRNLWPRLSLGTVEIRRYASEFWTYSHPMITYALAGLLAGLADRWLLQYFAGTVEQGFFGLALQIAALCLLATSSFVPLIGREFARAHEIDDRETLRRLFVGQVPRFYALTCLPAVFLACNAGDVVRLVGGAAFSDAVPAITLMCLAPIHQCYGQLNGTLFYATGHTRQYRNIGIGLLLATVPLNIVLLAPPTMYGLGLGAVGLAVKFLAIQLIGVNLQLWWITRYLHLHLGRLLVQQFSIICTLGVLAGAAVLLVQGVPWLEARLAAAGLVYTGLVLALARITPAILPMPLWRWLAEVNHQLKLLWVRRP